VIAIRTAICALVAFLALAQTGTAQSAPATIVGPMPPVMVIGFVGGFIRHDNLAHSEVQLGARLRQAYPLGVRVEIFESYHRGKALSRVREVLDTNHDRKLTAGEKQSARIIIYGHSWGGSQAVNLARDLEKEGIPVLLTVQVDSISIHHNDRVIPANVAQAANFYQSHGLLRGQSAIRASDSTRTHIIGNFRSDYKASSYSCEHYPWYDHVFVKAHTQIECDVEVWKRAEALIRSDLAPITASETEP
jgi:pimeloyl-ACP methyl ester carboxylesterase